MNKTHAQKIVEWRDSLIVLPENQFFELMRMYLGEIQTPFNKQNLIENLSSFLRKIENKEKIVKLLSESDLKVIAACKFIKNPTQKKLTTFFEDTFNFSKLYERINNLEERLILYRVKENDKIYIKINPHLDEIFEKVVKKSILIKKASIINFNSKIDFKISPEIIASFVSFVNDNPDLCKADGTFKKRTLAEIENHFPNPSIEKPLFLIKTAFENLSILIVNESGKYFVNKERLKAFSKLTETLQYSFIAVASQGRFSRNSLSQQAKLLIETILNIPEEGYTKENLLHSAYLKSERKNENTGEAHFGSKSRFASIIQNASQNVIETKENCSNDENVFSILDRLLDSAIELGLLKIKGIEENGNDVFEPYPSLIEELNYKNESELNERKVLSIDAAFNVMLFPGLNLKNLIELTDFLTLKKFDTAVSFEINKKSIIRGFDSGLTDEEILKILKKNCIHDLPQNLLISIEDWKKVYSSISIYKGYVLKISEETNVLSEKNPVFASHILEILAPGIYLLDVSSDEEIKKILEENGNNTVGKIKSTKSKTESADFPSFYVDIKNNFNIEEENYENQILTTEEERKAHFDYLREKLNSMNLTQEERECLLFRINRKIILDESQLKTESIKFAKIEATGIDFSGKVHIIEQAIIDKCYIELTFMTIENTEENIVVGIPLSTEKYDDDVTVKIKLNDKNVIKTYSISQACKVRRIYGSLFR